MKTSVRIATVLAATGAVALCALGFTSALEGAGQFKTLHAVQAGLVIGILPAYFVVLWLAAWSTYKARALTQRSWRHAAYIAIGVAAAAGAFFAPLLPSASLAAACLSQALCPDAANPVLWSYLQIVTSLPAMPLVIGLAVVLCAANAPIRRSPAQEA